MLSLQVFVCDLKRSSLNAKASVTNWLAKRDITSGDFACKGAVIPDLLLINFMQYLQ